MAYENEFGSFASGMSNGMSIGMKYRDQQAQQQMEEDRRRREEEARRQQEATAAQIQAQQQPQGQQGGMSINPSMIQQFLPSSASASGATGTTGASAGAGETGGMGILGGGASGTGAGAGLGSGAGAGAGAGAGGGAGAGASGAGGALAAAGPWAALAAIIAVNEKSAHNSGDRRTGWAGMKDLATGKVVEQDAHGNRIQKILGSQENDKTGLANDAAAVGDLSTFDFKNGFKSAGKGVGGRLIKSTVGKLFK